MCTTQHIFLYTDTNKRQDSARCAPAAGAALRRCVAAPKCPPRNETGGRSGAKQRIVGIRTLSAQPILYLTNSIKQKNNPRWRFDPTKDNII